MKLKPILSLAFSMITVCSFAQYEPATDINNVTKVNFISPGASYEARIATFQSVLLQGFINTSASFAYSDALGTSSSIYLDPVFTAQYRYYYNARQRAEKGKMTTNNNLNYVAAVYETSISKMAISSNYYEEDARRPINKVGAVWGIQRNYKSRFSLDLNLGLGYLFTKGTTYDFSGNKHTETIATPTGLGQIHFGFWVHKRK